jgi:hypothetical protein
MVAIFNILQAFSTVCGVIMVLAFLPQATALPDMMPFPDIPFEEFSQFVQENLLAPSLLPLSYASYLVQQKTGFACLACKAAKRQI